MPFLLSLLPNEAWPIFAHVSHRHHNIVCMERVKSESITGFDNLFDQLLVYLENYYRLLTTSSGRCESAEMLIDSRPYLKRSERYRCLNAIPAIKRQLRHITAILEDPQSAKACFEPSLSGVDEDFRGYTPLVRMQRQSTVARVLARKTMEDMSMPNRAIYRSMKSFLAQWPALFDSLSWKSDLSIPSSTRGLNTLWMSSAWIPFYLNREEAGSAKFRGGYFYTELVGPYGMLAIKSIDGEHFDHEVGLTVQRGDTVYPRHYHNAGELYITLSNTQCDYSQQLSITPYGDKNQLAVNIAPHYISTRPSHDAIYYISPRYLHSFKALRCEGAELPLISLWTRTGIYQGEQKTHFLRWHLYTEYH